MLLTCTEHVVSDFNFGGCLANILVYNRDIELLQNCGEVAWASGPCFFQVSPTSYTPLVTCQHQPVEGSMSTSVFNSFLLPGCLAANSLNKPFFFLLFFFLRAQRRLLLASIFRTGGQSPHLCTISLVGRQTGWM